MEIVHLHNHSHYSLLDGLTKIDELVDYTKERGAKAVAITDHGTMYGVIEFYQKCKKAGIKPIIGVETYLAPNSRFDKTRSEEKNYYHLLLLAKNNVGYKNLIKLTSIAHLEGFYYKPRIDWEVLKKYSDGLIASTACLGGEIPRLILSGKLEKAERRILEYNNLFGQGNFYLELMPHKNLEGQWEVNRQLISFSHKLNIPLVVTNDNHYVHEEDAKAQDILLCLQNKKKIEDIDRMSMAGNNYSMRTGDEIADILSDLPGAEEGIKNTLKIAEKCDVNISLGKVILPHFDVPQEFDNDSYLKKLCEEGVKKRYSKDVSGLDNEHRERMEYELSVIKKMGWPSYFLIVADFVNWAKSNKIVVGPGRGSAAGSLVCYLLGITDLDPLEYGLLFERFLNPDRVSMPDIDMDFADLRRDDVIKYVEKKYGEDHVAQIITFGTMAARAAVRDVGRVLNTPYDYCDKLAKMIPMFTDLKKALSTVKELRDIYNTEDSAKKILDFAIKLEGVARHSSTHACGIVITKEPLTEYVPLQYASSSDKSVITQYSLNPIEQLGLLKMDFLGLKNLTIIESAIKIIKNTRGLEVDIASIPLDDKKTFDLFQLGETTGVFQFESSGMKRYLRDLKPTEFEDIIAMVALYRPGPMEWIPDYIDGKHGRKKPKYLHPKLEPILSKTYGVAIYQEQVMQMARDLAGFTMAEADVLRKAVGKKIAKLLNEQKINFIEGCVKNQISTKLAEQIFSFIEPFAGYGFNRSHAACYALIGYQTAYLKAHWPGEFMAALLTADQQNTDRIAIEIDECRHMGIEVKQPDVNQSFDTFTVVTSGTLNNNAASAEEKIKVIRFGLKAIKNIGEHIVEVLIKERKKNGPYKDISDILERVIDKDLNKKSLESLIKTGALDEFGERGMLMGNLENILKYSKEITAQKNSRQNSLFGDMTDSFMKIRLEDKPEIDRQVKLSWERELLGLYISEHPYSDYHNLLEGKVKLARIKELEHYINEDKANVCGIITGIKKIITRSNEAMLFVKIEDNVNNTEILVFPRLLKETDGVWVEGAAVLLQGTVSDKDNEIKVLANVAVGLDLKNIDNSIEQFKIKLSNAPANRRYKFAKRKEENKKNKEVENAGINKTNPLKLIFLGELEETLLNSLKSILVNYPGEEKVYFKIGDGTNNSIIETNFRVETSNKLKEEIRENLKDKVSIAE